MNTSLKYTVLSLGLLVAGFLTYNIFFEQALSQLKSSTTEFMASSMTAQFRGRFIFCIAVGSIPLLYLFTSSMAKLQSKTQAALVYAIIILTGLVFWQLRIYYLKGQIEGSSASLLGTGIQNSMDISSLHLSQYALFGFIAGSLISLGMLKGINSTKNSLDSKE